MATNPNSANPVDLKYIDQADHINEDVRPIAYLRNIGTVLRKARLLTYSSEVGESGRPVMHRNIVRGLYSLSFGYVGLDIAHFYAKTAKQVGDTQIEVAGIPMAEKNVLTADRAAWHSMASFAFPTLAIHSIVKHSKKTLIRTGMRYPHIAAPVLGLVSIPFIIHPIDEVTDWIMDNTVRRLYRSDRD